MVEDEQEGPAYHMEGGTPIFDGNQDIPDNQGWFNRRQDEFNGKQVKIAGRTLITQWLLVVFGLLGLIIGYGQMRVAKNSADAAKSVGEAAVSAANTANRLATESIRGRMAIKHIGLAGPITVGRRAVMLVEPQTLDILTLLKSKVRARHIGTDCRVLRCPFLWTRMGTQ
jgi:hypothetical protein